MFVVVVIVVVGFFPPVKKKERKKIEGEGLQQLHSITRAFGLNNNKYIQKDLISVSNTGFRIKSYSLN